ncbi:hypothetical protein Tco_0431239 [Tanacetum coccineum]
MHPTPAECRASSNTWRHTGRVYNNGVRALLLICFDIDKFSCHKKPQWCNEQIRICKIMILYSHSMIPGTDTYQGLRAYGNDFNFLHSEIDVIDNYNFESGTDLEDDGIDKIKRKKLKEIKKANEREDNIVHKKLFLANEMINLGIQEEVAKCTRSCKGQKDPGTSTSQRTTNVAAGTRKRPSDASTTPSTAPAKKKQATRSANACKPPSTASTKEKQATSVGSDSRKKQKKK